MLDTTNFFAIKNKNVRIWVSNTRVSRPIRVVLKAPFHYKVGKHRLSLLSIRKTIRVGLGIRKTTGPASVRKILAGLGTGLEHIPRLTNPQNQTKRVRARLPFVLDKGFFGH